MTPRERIKKAINHLETDIIPLDLGATDITSMSINTYAKLRKALGLPSQPPKIREPLQMLAEIDMDFIEKLGIDTIALDFPTTMFGFKNKNWKPWQLFDGTKVLIPEDFVTTSDSEGNIFLYPQGDASVAPSGKMPPGGFYFDPLVRQEPIDQEHLDPQEWVEDQYSLLTEEDLSYLEKTVDHLYKNTDLAIVNCFGQGGFGDIALVPGPGVKHPKGIRDPQEWYVAHLEHPDYIKGIFELQCRIALKNLELLYQAVGNRIEAVVVSGTDFGTQNASFISPKTYREIYKPFHQRLNDWIHQHTQWKVFYHTCGSVISLLDDLVEVGVDILNPVQCSAKGMEAEGLKSKYGDQLVFWGGGVDTQKTLPFGTPAEVKKEVEERCRTLGRGGGFVFAAIHNIQPRTPVENLLAMFEALGRL